MGGFGFADGKRVLLDLSDGLLRDSGDFVFFDANTGANNSESSSLSSESSSISSVYLASFRLDATVVAPYERRFFFVESAEGLLDFCGFDCVCVSCFLVSASLSII